MKKPLITLSLLSLLTGTGLAPQGAATLFDHNVKFRRPRKSLKGRRKNPKGCHDFSGRAFNRPF